MVLQATNTQTDTKKSFALENKIFASTSDRNKKSVLKFMADSISLAAQEYQDRWAVSLHSWGFRLNVGRMAMISLSEDHMWILVDEKTALHALPHAKFEKRKWKSAPGCKFLSLSYEDASKSLTRTREAHINAMKMAGLMKPSGPIRGAHSAGTVEFFARVASRKIGKPSYYVTPDKPLHLLNGGYNNGDLALLKRATRGTRKARGWIVPKSAAIGDDVVINVFSQGLYCVGRIASSPKKPAARSGERLYRADLDDLQLLAAPIALTTVLHEIPELNWARYPRSIHTPSPDVADHLRYLIEHMGGVQFEDLDNSTDNEPEGQLNVPLKKGTSTYWRRCSKVSRSVLKRAGGRCEGCGAVAPFRRPSGAPYLEEHHTIGKDADTPKHVIALCPNCHRRTDFSEDKAGFNASLIAKLKQMYGAARS